MYQQDETSERLAFNQSENFAGENITRPPRKTVAVQVFVSFSLSFSQAFMCVSCRWNAWTGFLQDNRYSVEWKMPSALKDL